MVHIFDTVHGYINFSDDELKFLDNKWVKRLKRIKQLGQLDQVFPCASHSRFEHSIGVAHLSEKYCKLLNINSNKTVFDETDILCVKLAGLFHDLGHGPFSHVFDNVVLKNCCRGCRFKEHEARSQMIVDKIFSEVGAINGLNGYHINLIKQMIEPDPLVNMDNINKPLFSIVNNKSTNIDVDKFDYLLRDPIHIGLDFSFDSSRIMLKSYAYGNDIVYDKSLASNIFDLFYTRYKFHKEIYNHKTVKVIELMIGDALTEANNKYNFCSMLDVNDDFLKLDDSIYSNILFSDDRDLFKSKSIINRIETRNLYKQIYSKQVNNLKDWNEDEFIADNYPDYNRDNLRVVKMKLNLCNGNKNPLDKCLFRQHKNDITSIIGGHEVEMSKLDMSNCEENTVMVFDIN